MILPFVNVGNHFSYKDRRVEIAADRSEITATMGMLNNFGAIVEGGEQLAASGRRRTLGAISAGVIFFDHQPTALSVSGRSRPEE